MVTLGEASAALPQADARPDREPAAQPLGQGQYVGLHAFGLVGEPCPGPADAALDLIDYQQRAGEIAGFPGGAQITLRGRHDSALAEDGLQEDGRDIGTDGCAQRVGVAERHKPHGQPKWGELIADGRLAGQRERPHRPAVEAALGSHQYRPPWSLDTAH